MIRKIQLDSLLNNSLTRLHLEVSRNLNAAGTQREKLLLNALPDEVIMQRILPVREIEGSRPIHSTSSLFALHRICIDRNAAS